MHYKIPYTFCLHVVNIILTNNMVIQCLEKDIQCCPFSQAPLQKDFTITIQIIELILAAKKSFMKQQVGET